MEKENQQQLPKEKMMEKAKKTLQDFQAMENIHDLVKKKIEVGNIGSSEVARMMRLVKVFEGNSLSQENALLEFKKGEKNDNENIDASIKEAHSFMMKLPTEIGKDGRIYLDIWNKTVYEKYVRLNKMRIDLLKKEVLRRKKQGEGNDKSQAYDILQDM